MHYLTMLLGSLLSMLGFSEAPGQTSVTRISGEHSLLSRTTVRQDEARFQCLQSESGSCFYQLYREHCAAGQGVQTCNREPLMDFAVAVGSTRQMRDLPVGFAQQVQVGK